MPAILDLLRRRNLSRSTPGLRLGRNVEIVSTSFGKNVNLSSDITLYHSEIGDYSYIGPICRLNQASVGKYCSIAGDVRIGLGQHPTEKFVSTHPRFYLSRRLSGWDLVDRDLLPEFAKTTIGNDVWIGCSALVRDGVTIGDGAIVAAGAVVVTDIEPYAIYGGVPARRIRYRFSSDQIAFLLDWRWWDRDEDWIAANLAKFQDINLAIEEYAGTSAVFRPQ